MFLWLRGRSPSPPHPPPNLDPPMVRGAQEVLGRLLLLAWERCWSPDPQTVQRGARALVMTRLGLGGLQARLLLRPVALSAVSLPPRPMTLHRFYINTKRPDIGLELSEEDWARWITKLICSLLIKPEYRISIRIPARSWFTNKIKTGKQYNFCFCEWIKQKLQIILNVRRPTGWFGFTKYL